MTFRDIIGRNDDGGVGWHEHDASDISGEGVYTDLKVDKLLGGTILGKEIIVAGGTDGILRSDNFVTGSAGWQIDGSGAAEFNDVTVRGAVYATGGEFDWADIINVSVETADIADAAITNAKIADLAVTNAKIVNATITDAKIASLTASKITAGTITSETITIGTSGKIQGSGGAWEINESLARFGGGSHTITLDPSDYPAGQARFRTDHSGGYLVNGGVSYIWDYDPSSPYIRLRRSSRAAGVVTNLALLDIASTGLISYFPILTNDGSASSPAYGFRNDTDTGLYLLGTNIVGFAGGGTEQFRTGNSTNPGLQILNGTASTPALRFSSDTDTGVYSPGNGQFAVSIGGTRELLLGATGFLVPNVYNATTADAANVNVASDGTLARSTSSARYKTDIAPFAPTASVLDLTPSTFRPKDDPDRLLLGLIAEDVDNYFPLAAIPDDEGRPDAIDWNAIVSGLVAEVQQLRARVGALEAA